jgi:hypothetical protein
MASQGLVWVSSVQGSVSDARCDQYGRCQFAIQRALGISVWSLDLEITVFWDLNPLYWHNFTGGHLYFQRVERLSCITERERWGRSDHRVH